MIDWWDLFTSSLWVSGLAVALAVFSHIDWRAAQDSQGMRTVASLTLRTPLFLAGGATVCIGVGLSMTAWWRSVLWLLLAAGLALQTARARRRQKGTMP
jgi:hypothetical protein